MAWNIPPSLGNTYTMVKVDGAMVLVYHRLKGPDF